MWRFLSLTQFNYSCEVIQAASRFRVEKVSDPDSDGGGRIISSKFIDTTPPDVKMFPENYEVQTNIIVTCLVSGFYPNNITLNMKRNGRILTREDGVKSSGVCSYEDDTFQRRDFVEIKTSDTSDFCCEVIHAASGSRVEKFWYHHLPPPPHSGGAGDDVGAAIGVLVLFLVLVVMLVLVGWKKRRILEAANRCRTGAAANNPSGNYSPDPTEVVEDLPPGGEPAAAAPPPPDNDNTTNHPEAESLLEEKVQDQSDVSINTESIHQ
ncbi:uncharacterized protein LOC125019941 [Mugil cephalus]|uniref:uncharacterized protein LOC125019941 n=1 Tax=Mugil cephalus TaxID=48193 RepID=UPI001FB678D4|nr:uncharacterized protein LOC125019941 [Mugil cephalus]